MDTLSKHIEYLLLRHDCVVVPGVGAFINVRHKAHYDAEAGMWYPMLREVRFNSALHHDDGLLSNSYARKEGAGYAEGRELCNRAIKVMLRVLEEDGEATLGNLGILRRNQDGNLTFTPSRSESRMAEVMGFMPAPISSSKKGQATMSNRQGEGNEILDKIADYTADSVASSKEPGRRFDTDKNYYIGINKIFARTAACFMLVAAVALWILLPIDSGKNVDKASVLPMEKIMGNHTEASSKQAIHPESTPAKEGSGLAPTGPYHLIVATFRSESDAEKYISQHEEDGYELEIVKGGKMYRVSAADSDDSASLYSLCISPDFQGKFSQAWVWEEK